jgi:hypothetical protein
LANVGATFTPAPARTDAVAPGAGGNAGVNTGFDSTPVEDTTASALAAGGGEQPPRADGGAAAGSTTTTTRVTATALREMVRTAASAARSAMGGGEGGQPNGISSLHAFASGGMEGISKAMEELMNANGGDLDAATVQMFANMSSLYERLIQLAEKIDQSQEDSIATILRR